MLSDHYNPMTKTLALSEPVYDQPSVAAIGVACHEAGHAIQHAENYAPLWLRSVLVPTANIGSSLGYIVMIAGLFMSMMNVFLIGAVMFSMVLLFQVVTLPVEFDASARAKKLAFANGLVLDSEREGMSRVLNAAALTYVAAAVSTLMTLLYFLMRAGLLGGRSRLRTESPQVRARRYARPAPPARREPDQVAFFCRQLFGVSASATSRRKGSVFDGRTLNHQVGYWTVMPSR